MRDNGLIQIFSISARQEVIEPVSWTVNNEGRSFVKWNPSDHVRCPFIKNGSEGSKYFFKKVEGQK